MPSDQLVRTLNQHQAAVNAVRFTHDGTYCITASDDRTVKLWNPHRPPPVAPIGGEESALCIQTYSGVHGYGIFDVAISKDKSKFASAGGDKSCFVWDVTTGKVIRKIQAHSHRINSIAYNHDDSVLFTASYDQSVKCWDMRSANREPIQVLKDFKDSVTTVVNTSTAIIACSVDGYVRIYDMRQGCMHYDFLQDPITNLRVAEDEQSYLVSCLHPTKATVRLMDITTGKLLRDYSGHRHDSFKIEACFESNNQQSIVSGSEEGTLYHWDVVSGQLLDTTRSAHTKAIASISYHPTMNIFLSASYDGTVKCWNRK